MVLGRVFAADGILSTVAQIASTLFVGWAMDAAGASPRVVMAILGVAVLLPGLAWWLMPRGDAAPVPTVPTPRGAAPAGP